MRLIDAEAFKAYMRGALEQTRRCYLDGGEWAEAVTEEFCRDIDEQPTVQPDHTADIGKKVSISCGHENDLISRQAAIEAMGKAKWAKERLMELPSAQPELIAQDAYVRGFEQGRTQGMVDSQGGKKQRKVLITTTYNEMGIIIDTKAEEIAQPEIIRCKDCDWWTKQEDSVQGRCELMQMYPTEEWYCGNARRRQE